MASYSFQKRKTILVKANVSFLLGHLLLQLLKEMILSWKRNTGSLENIKYNRPSDKKGLEISLFYFPPLKSSRMTTGLPSSVCVADLC